jgi:hypothetical protein
MTATVLRDRLAALLAPRYTLDRELAAGGMARVFLGHDPALGRDVAIKLLPPEQATAVARERFLREARLLAQLAHPHVVPILEVQEQGGLLWFVMPLIAGDTLATRIAAGALPLGEVRRIGDELLDALAFAHSHGVIHRDVKPGNVFLHGDHALLADFGVALLHDPNDDTLTEAGRLLGTLRYMTPEQLTGAAATVRSDLYSLGATLYEAATGRQWSPALHSVAATWKGIEPRFAAVLHRALEPLPERRWPDAASFRTALEDSGRRHVSRLVIATGIVATAVVVAALALSRSSALPAPTYDLRIMPFEGRDSVVARDVYQYVAWAFDGFARLRVVPSGRVAGREDSVEFTVDAQFKPGSAGFDSLHIGVLDGRGNSRVGFWVPGDTGARQDWGAAVADSLVAELFPGQLDEFRMFTSCKGKGQQWPDNVWKAYWAGEVAFQESRWEDAENKFQEAWHLDSTFATALWYRNLSRQFRRVASDSELTSLARHSDQFCPPLKDLVRIQANPDLDDRMAGFERLAREFPKYPPIRLVLANELFHRGPLIGRELREGVDTFRSGAAQLADLDQATTYQQVIWGALRLGEEGTAREALRRRAAVIHDSFNRFLRLATEGRFRSWLARPLLRVTLWFADDAFVAQASQFVRLGLEFDVPQEQLTIGRLLAGPKHGTTDSSRRASGFAAEATALLLLGRPLEALRQLDSGAAFARSDSGYQLQPAEWRLLLPIAGMPIPRGEIEAGRRRLAAVPASDPRWPRATWALMLAADARHDVAVRDRLREELRARAPSDSVARHLVPLADAMALGSDGRVDSALARSRAIHRDPGYSVKQGRGPLVRALTYLKRGEWQLASGDSTGADREWLWHENNDLRGWPAGEPQEGELDAALSALVRLHRADLFLARGEQLRACQLYRRVNELWHNAEPSFDSLRHVVQGEVDRCPA